MNIETELLSRSLDILDEYWNDPLANPETRVRILFKDIQKYLVEMEDE